MSSHQEPGFDDFATRRREPSGPRSAARSEAPRSGSGFGTQSQWRKPGPGGGRPQFSAPQAFPAYQAPAPPHGSGQPHPSPQLLAPPQPPRQPYPPQHYPAPYASQFQQPGQFGQQPGQFGQQPYPVGYPQYPRQAPQRKSLAPVVILCVVAVVAVLSVVALTRDRATPDGYHNDDYQIPPAAGVHPPLPRPASDAEVVNWLEDNAIYQQSVAQPVRCELADFDHTTATSDEKKVQLEATLECLVRVWGPTVEAAGFTITHPTVTMYDSPIQGACGKTAMRNAFYCALDQNLYFATDLHTIFGAKSADQWAYEAVMAHEFGHSLQGRTGIIPARNELLKDETDKEVAYLSVRRTEAQADCLAGLFFNSTQQSLGLTSGDIESIQNLYGSIGNKDPAKISTHPQPASRYRWFQTGIANTSVGSCNSFTVAPDEVK